MTNLPAKFLIGVMGLLGVACLAIGATIDTRPEWDIVAYPDGIELGDVPPETTQECTLRVVNRGKSRAHLKKVTTSCGCTVIESVVEDLAEHGMAEVKVKIQTGISPGQYIRFILMDIQGETPAQRRVIDFPIHLRVAAANSAIPETEAP